MAHASIPVRLHPGALGDANPGAAAEARAKSGGEAPRADTLRAIVLMVVSMCAFAAADAAIKAASGGATPGQMIAVQSLVAGILFLGMMRRRRERPDLEAMRRMAAHPPILWRTGAEAVAAVSIVTALGLMPLGNAAAVLQVQPLIVTLGAAFVLRERVTLSRWLAVAVGLAGVLVIIRPAADGFTAASWLVVLGALALAVRDIATNRVDRSFSTASISVFITLGLFAVGLVLHALTDRPWGMDAATGAIVLLGSLFVALGMFTVAASMRLGEVSAVAPYRYSRLLAAGLLGWAVFGEVPDLWTLVGSLMVIGAGLYSLTRG